MIEIYGLDDCEACKTAYRLCEENGLKYHYYLATSEKVAKFTTDTVAPFILVDGNYLGSLNHFQVWLADVVDRIDALKTYLKDDVHIEFRKTDGTLRTMHCTQNFDLIPVEHHPAKTDNAEEVSVPTKNKDNFLLKVFDLEAKGWRSIRAERIVRFS